MKSIKSLILIICLAFVADYTALELSSANVAYAKKKKRGKKRANGARKRIVVKEAKAKFTKRDKTNVDFDEATLEGRRLNPSGVSLNLQKPNKDFDLIKLRRHWKPEMVSSTSSLETR